MPATLEQPEAIDREKTPAAAARPRVLMLTHRLPYPPDRGDRIRSFHLLKHLSHHFDIAIACVSDEPVWLQHHQLLSTMARRVDIQPISGLFKPLRGAMALLTGRPVTPALHFRQGLAQTIQQWHEQQPFDAVLTFCTGMIDYARLITRPRRPKSGAKPVRHVLDLVDVDSLKWASYAKTSWPPMRWVYGAEARRLRRVEAGDFDHFDAVTVISEAEADAYRQHVGDHPGLAVVGNGVDLKYFSPMNDAGTKNIVFVGVLNYRPNYEGVVWFAHHVMPKLRQRVPEAKFQIVGRHPTPRIEQLAEQPGVEVVGSVPDVRAFLESAVAVIAPLQIARGVQNKVLEAMACARAVVCSQAAAQGVAAVDGEHLLAAQDPDQWVNHLERVLTDADLRTRLGASARQFVEQHYTWKDRLAPMVQILAGDEAK
jgi:sugar transferase (PEP-CTERM/EpsH1 system associated)